MCKYMKDTELSSFYFNYDQESEGKLCVIGCCFTAPDSFSSLSKEETRKLYEAMKEYYND